MRLVALIEELERIKVTYGGDVLVVDGDHTPAHHVETDVEDGHLLVRIVFVAED